VKVLIAGATGFVGKALVRAFILRGDEVIVLGRAKAKIDFIFKESILPWTWVDLETKTDPVDLIINLAGASIYGWWSKNKKEKIVNSRLAAIKRLTAFCHRQKERLGKSPRFFQANGVGIYGTHGDRVYDENSPLPQETDFLSELGRRIETTATEGASPDIPLVMMRFGVILDANGGMLENLFPLFKYGFGTIFGNGKQFLSWISRADLVKAMLFLSDHAEINGVFNLVAKEPVTQQAFSKAYARYLKRPLWLHFPPFLIKILFGEMGETLLLGSQKVIPHRLLELGFEFEYPNLSYYFAK
jgi:uncharacterized protein (TIGR01777 family)